MIYLIRNGGENMIDIVNKIIVDAISKTMSFFPNLIGGIFVLFLGFFLGSLIKKLTLTFLFFIRLDALFHKTKLLEKKEVRIWEEILTEILRWTTIVLFLIPSFEIWGLSRATMVLNQFLFYLPNVIVAVIIAFVGLATSNLGADLVKSSLRTVGTSLAITLSVLTKWLIVFFTVLVVFNQLGVAQDLIRILFTGIVAMIALAGGLAFGLGGKDLAKELLEELKKKIES